MVAFAVKGVVANAGRQRMLRLPGVPSYQEVIDETTVRRLAAPPEVAGSQPPAGSLTAGRVSYAAVAASFGLLANAAHGLHRH